VIYIREPWEIKNIYKSSQIIKDTLEYLEKYIKPGVTTIELDRIAENFIRDNEALPGFKGLYGYPATICASIDDEVVHGIPCNRVLENGQIISLDIGAIYNGYYGDHAKTFIVGDVSKEIEQLIEVTRESLNRGVSVIKPGKYIGDIGYEIQNYVESFGYGIVRELVGHGIGEKLHEDPQIPNYGIKNNGFEIKEGMCFAIEPMVTLGSYEVFTKEDQWTVCTVDSSLAAHFEHTVTVTKDGVKVLTK